MIAEIKSFSTDTEYELTIDEKNGAAVRCTCPGCQYGKSHNCRHMQAFNAEVQRAATFILLQERVKTIEAQTSDVLQTRRILREMAFV